MADEEIYYMFSRRTPSLQEKLQQRDRLVDRLVYLDVLNLREIRLTLLHGPRPRTSAILLLAALLRPHPHRFPLNFRVDSINAPRAFYTFNFRSRLLPPPPGNSFGLDVLFALPVGSRSTLAVKLARFIFHVSTKIRSVSNNIHLWDLTFRVDRNHVLGALQFKTRDRHVKIQVEAHFWTNSFFAIDPITHEFISYRMLRGPQISDHAASTHLRQINNSLNDLTRNGQIYDWQSINVVE